MSGDATVGVVAPRPVRALVAPLTGYFDRRFAELHEHVEQSPRVAELTKVVEQQSSRIDELEQLLQRQSARIEELTTLLQAFAEAIAARSERG